MRFRVYNSVCWTGSYLCVALATMVMGLAGRRMLFAAIGILVIGRMMNGLGRGGGAIAWTLAISISPASTRPNCTCIHVALTGLRGLLMPLLGSLANNYLDWGSFVIAAGLAFTAYVMFSRLAVRCESRR